MNQSSPSKIELDELLYLFQNRKFDEAERLAVSLSKRFPKHPFSWTVHGIVLQQTGRIIESLSSMQKPVQLAPKDAGAHSNLGNTFKALGRLNEAEKSYDRAIALKPDFAEAHSNLGVTLQEMGRFDEAAVSHAQAIALKPDYAEAYSNLGVTLHELGRLNEAEENYRQALVLKPDHAETYYNLGNTLQELGRIYEAEKNYREAILLNPYYAEAHYNLAVLLQDSHRVKEAEESYTEAISFNPEFAEAHSNLGVILQQLGRLDEAEASHARAIALKPDYAEAHSNLGVLLQELGRLDESEASYARALALKPHYAEAHCNLGITLQEMGRPDEAEACYIQAIALKPGYAEAHSNLGNTFKALGRLNEAKASYKRAIAINPDYAEAHSNLGSTLKALGRLDEAEASYTRAIASKPDFAEAHRQLTTIKNSVSKDEQYFKMRELYLDDNTSEEQLVHLNFGLAKACEDLGEFKQAFIHYTEGNALRKSLLNYDINQDVKLFEQIKISYPSILSESLQSDHLTKTTMPIFIVGLPRSGTTLVEQIISAHSKVTGAGELSYVNKFGEFLAIGSTKISSAALLAFREKYLGKLQNIACRNSIVTDKMPHNFLYTGLIAAALPEAKIVHVKRDPAAVCWANYKQYFSRKGLGYCYALEDVVTYHRLYENLMEFWQMSLSEKIYNLDYELLVENQKDESYKLVEYLGLDWDEKCLSPQDNMRSVTTASSIQIRKKVYQGSSLEWKKYETFLDGAFDEFITL